MRRNALARGRVGPTSRRVRTRRRQGLLYALLLAGAVSCKGTVAPTTQSAIQPLSPGQVTDLAFDTSSATFVRLVFAEVEDGGGRPANYAIRAQTPTIIWDSAGASQRVLSGTQVGGRTQFVFDGLTPDTEYEFQMIAFRGSLDTGAVFGDLSNIVSGSTGGTPVDTGGTDTTGVGGDGSEPFPGANSADALIFMEGFEDYGTSVEMIIAGGGPWNSGGSDVRLDVGGGRGAGNALHIPKPTGTTGPSIERSGLGAPTHFFAQYYFRLVTGANPNGVAKWVIVRHTAEGTPGCGGNGVARYQFDWTTITSVFGVTVPNSRFRQRGEYDTVCSGPVSGTTGLTGYFKWGNNPQEPAPVLAEDPDIGLAPWNPINDGNWHRHTIEIKVGAGLDGYTKLWLDGFLYWDSSESPMSQLGIPTTFMFETVGSGAVTPGFDAWFDDIVLWKRVLP